VLQYCDNSLKPVCIKQTNSSNQRRILRLGDTEQVSVRVLSIPLGLGYLQVGKLCDLWNQTRTRTLKRCTGIKGKLHMFLLKYIHDCQLQRLLHLCLYYVCISISVFDCGLSIFQ